MICIASMFWVWPVGQVLQSQPRSIAAMDRDGGDRLRCADRNSARIAFNVGVGLGLEK
jgi:hypothetical protein